MRFTQVAIVDDEIDHAVISRLVLSQVAPQVAVSVFTDPHGLDERLLELPAGALVVVDRMLGRTESFGLVRQLTAARPDLSVVLVSAVLTPEDGRRALSAGATAAAEKPGDLAGWRTLFRGLLASDQPGRSDGTSVA